MRQLPNVITFSRVAVLAALVWLVHEDWAGAATLAFFAILYGAVSDFVDGWLARKYGFVTNFGKIMDATVDKVMVLGAFALLIYLEILVPFWLTIPLVALIGAREVGVTWMRVVAARKGIVLAAEKAGKRKTIWQTTAICVLFAVPMFKHDFPLFFGRDFSLWVDFVYLNGYLYFLLAAVLTIQSGCLYLARHGSVFFAKARE